MTAGPRVHPIVGMGRRVQVMSFPLSTFVLYTTFLHRDELDLALLVLLLMYGFVWPWVAWWRARNSRDSRAAERWNLTADTLLVGAWMASMHFSILPSLMLFAGVYMGVIGVGGRALALGGLAAMALGIVAVGLWSGFGLQAGSAVPATLASICGICFYSSLFAYSSYRQSRSLVDSRRELRARSREIERQSAAL